VRIGNWLTVEQAEKLLQAAPAGNYPGQARSSHPGFADRLWISANCGVPIV
jgi:hypothetical protein